MEMFSMLRSKRTSEAGVWVNDEEVHECPLCGRGFNLLIRKHHCRQCGQVVCGSCSDNRVFLESSRTGAQKRVCDPCFNKSRKAEPDEDEEEEEDSTEAVRRAMGKASVSSASTAAGSSGSAGGRPGAPGAGAKPAVPVVSLPEISPAEAVEGLKNVQWNGRWKFTFIFYTVELGKVPAGANNLVAASSFRGVPVPGKEKGGGPVRPGSKVPVFAHLKPKGQAYFQGEVPEFGQFGKEGKVTGALQRSSGKVNMTVQIVSPVTKVTTSFNLVGGVNREGTFVGQFNGCEISKTAGTVSGVFTAQLTPEEEKGAGAGAAGGSGGDGSDGEDGGSVKAHSDSDSDGGAGSKKKGKGAKGGGGSKAAASKSPSKAKAKRKGSDSDSD